MPRNLQPHPNALRDYYAGLAAAKTGEPKPANASAWWLQGYEVGDGPRWLDALLSDDP